MHENNKERETTESFSIRLKKYIKNLLDFSKFDKKTIFFIFVFVFLVAVSLFLLYYIYFIDSTFLYNLVVQYFVNPIFELGFWGIFLFLIVMMIQAIAVPIPSEIILLAAGMIWGVIAGGFMGIAGSMVSALLAYYIAKRGGRPLAEKFVGKNALGLADNFIKKYGTAAIIITRFLPFIAFDPISYASGIVKLDAKKYTIGTLLGTIPRAFIYAWLGASLNINPPVNLSDIPLGEIEQRAELFNNVLLMVLVVLIVFFISYYIMNKYYLEKRKNKPNNSYPQLQSENSSATDQRSETSEKIKET